MNLGDRCDAVATHTDLISFVSPLRDYFRTNAETWENQTLERYLEALEA
jgi:hypothetical protein